MSSEKMNVSETYVCRATKPHDKSSLRQISLRWTWNGLKQDVLVQRKQA